MSRKPIETLEVPDRQSWRDWLTGEHDRKKEIWLVFHKRHTGVQSIGYGETVEEAICFGWIDSVIRRIDDNTYVRKFTPRKQNSKWSTANRRRYDRLRRSGSLAPPGLKRPPTNLDGDRPEQPDAYLPSYIEESLRSEPAAWHHFERLAPSYRRNYVGWIDSAKRETTKMKRLAEARKLLAGGKKLPLK